MRAIFDTNVLLSGLLWRGPPHVLMEQVRGGALTLVSSPALIAAFADVIRRAKFAQALQRSGTDADRLLAELRRLAEIVDAPPLREPVSRDADDDAVLALAAAARPDLIVSGDEDILVLGRHEGIPIVTPAEAVGLTRSAS